jgi:hypothetical protein
MFRGLRQEKFRQYSHNELLQPTYTPNLCTPPQTAMTAMCQSEELLVVMSFANCLV